MKREFNDVKLVDKRNSKLVPAKLYKGIIDRNIEDYNNLWLPKFEEAKLKFHEEKIFIEDSHWDWGKKMNYIKDKLAFESFVIEADDKTQGMMIVDHATKFSRIENGKPIIYIFFLATAPWNRKLIMDTPLYGAVGKLLFYQAIGESIESKFEGRISLHSLPGAVEWYKYLGMEDFGEDINYNKLHYLELDKVVANKIINQLNT
jgi:hypothetical protein